MKNIMKEYEKRGEDMKDLFSKKRIGVLIGGWSSEREISLMSGKNIVDSLYRKWSPY
ncbi:hypothetical protein KAW96_10640 [candidate division WOR-3 bacterium]|nr:hypothetical protein [candidate division WOR-3 bacterium]